LILVGLRCNSGDLVSWDNRKGNATNPAGGQFKIRYAFEDSEGRLVRRQADDPGVIRRGAVIPLSQSCEDTQKAYPHQKQH